jgi:DNA invertase Pin-like site-specific DNA recombinase
LPCSAWRKGSTRTRPAGELVFHVFGAIAHFERRLIAERTKDGIAAARAKGKHPGRRPLDADKIAAALSLVKAGLSPTAAAKQLGLGRSTVYREVNRADIERYPAEARSLETAVGFASGELDA